jgi:hypothetical protein
VRCSGIPRGLLLVVVAGLLLIPAALFSQQTPSPSRSAHLSSVSGTVMVKPPGAAEGVKAQLDTPIQEGMELSTLGGSSAVVDLGNGATMQLSYLANAKLTQLATDENANKLTLITLEQGYADFHFNPEHQDVYKVRVADATFTAHGKTELLTGDDAGNVWARVVAGSAVVSAGASAHTLTKGKFLEYRPLMDEWVAKSHARVVRLSYVSGSVMVKRPGSAEDEKAMVNTPIQEGFELSTAGGSYAEVEFENGSTARMGELSKLLFPQLALDAEGNKLNGLTFEQGYATFHFLPGHKPSSPDFQSDKKGTIHFHPAYLDVYHVKIADATVTGDGKCEFRTDLDRDNFRVEVFQGSVKVVTPSQSSKLGEGKILEHPAGSTEWAFDTQKGIVKDDWDQWAEARDKQVELTQKNAAFHPSGSSYGVSELDSYGEWVRLPGQRVGWSPYAPPGWSPYSNGQWGTYPGLGWTWISSEPWGWLPYHCGAWDFDGSLGWYWMMPMPGCGLWEGARVRWYMGRRWIGWAPIAPLGHPIRLPPGRHPATGTGPHLVDHPARGLVTVPTSLVQNREMITPQTVNHLDPTAGTEIEHPPFELGPRPTTAEALPASKAEAPSKGIPPAATASPVLASLNGPGPGLGLHHSSAPSTILMDGNAARERSLLGHHSLFSYHDPLRAAQGTTLGGHYAMHGSPGEFRGGGLKGGGSGRNGSLGGPVLSASSGRSGVSFMSHGGGSSGGGAGRAGGGGFSGGGGGHAGGGFSGGGGGHAGGGGGGGFFGGGGGGGGGHH